MDIRSTIAAQKYAASRPATEPAAGSGNPQSMADMVAGAARDFTSSMQEAEAIAQNSMTGDVDPHSLVQALAQTELAVETAVTVRDKVVEAYQEILRMPV